MTNGLALVLVLALGLAGCGGDEDEGEESSGAGPPVSLIGTVNDHGTKTATGTFELELDEYYFGPTFVRATPGQRITIVLHNEGKEPHTFTVGEVDQELAPGTKRTVTVTAPQSGSITFTCRFHIAQGMQGAIFVA